MQENLVDTVRNIIPSQRYAAPFIISAKKSMILNPVHVAS